MADNNAIPEGAETPTGQPHLGPTVHHAISDLPDEVEIEIEGEPTAEGEEGAEPVAEEPKPAKHTKRPRSDPQRRIDQLTAQKREAETNAQRLARENEEMLAELDNRGKALADEKAHRERGDRAALLNHERAVKSDLAMAQRDYQHAVETGDVGKQTEAASSMARLEADKRDIDNWKAAHPERPATQERLAEREQERQQPRQQAQAKPVEQQIAELDEPAREWVEANDWFRPGTKTEPNPDFDMEMHTAAVNYAADLEKRLMNAGRKAEINTPAYFNKITAYVQREFEDRFDGSDPLNEDDGDVTVVPARTASNTPPNRRAAVPQARMPVMTRSNAVLPANGQQAQQLGKPTASKMRVQLSPDEKEMAVKQWENGAMGKHWKTGKPVSSAAEAVDQIAYRKAMIARNG